VIQEPVVEESIVDEPKAEVAIVEEQAIVDEVIEAPVEPRCATVEEIIEEVEAPLLAEEGIDLSELCEAAVSAILGDEKIDLFAEFNVVNEVKAPAAPAKETLRIGADIASLIDHTELLFAEPLTETPVMEEPSEQPESEPKSEKKAS